MKMAAKSLKDLALADVTVGNASCSYTCSLIKENPNWDLFVKHSFNGVQLKRRSKFNLAGGKLSCQ